MDYKNENNEYKPVEKHVKAQLAVLRENDATGWKRIVTVTRWGTGRYKLDIRDWNRDMTRSTKGVTFSRAEAIKLRNILTIFDMNLIDEFSTERRNSLPHNANAPVAVADPAAPTDPAATVTPGSAAGETADAISEIHAAGETAAQDETADAGTPAAFPIAEPLKEAV